MDHKCYIQTGHEKSKKQTETSMRGYIFFDYEAYQCQVKLKHIANLIIAEKVCIDCICKKPCNFDCQVHKFYTNNSFCKWLFGKENQNFTAIAHNFQGYDGVFLMEYIKESMLSIEKLPEIILNGTKILTLKFRGVRFIDSFSFIPMALEKFPKTFGLTELKKGFCPHLFNQPGVQNYIGEIPNESYFGSQFFNAQKKKISNYGTWKSLNKSTILK